MEVATANDIKVRGYLSMCFGCPLRVTCLKAASFVSSNAWPSLVYTKFRSVTRSALRILNKFHSLVSKLIDAVGKERLAMHFHDTRGTAIANVLASLELGIRVFDSSLGGLGGCPYAPAATGNVATEDIIYMLHGMGHPTGIDLAELIKINHLMTGQIQHELPSRVGRAGITANLARLSVRPSYSALAQKLHYFEGSCSVGARYIEAAAQSELRSFMCQKTHTPRASSIESKALGKYGR